MITALTTDRPAHGRQGSVWSYVSPSRLGLWLRCPLAFRFRYVDGIKEAFRGVEAFMGQQVHSTIEWLFNERTRSVELMP